jgi:uncharacterized protein with HEPN domain
MSAENRFSMFYVDEMLSNCLLVSARPVEYSMTEKSYRASSDFQDLLTMPLLRICELAARFEGEFKALIPSYDWDAMTEMRNQIAHPYGGFDIEFVWEAAVQDIPGLTSICKGILSTE